MFRVLFLQACKPWMIQNGVFESRTKRFTVFCFMLFQPWEKDIVMSLRFRLLSVK